MYDFFNGCDWLVFGFNSIGGLIRGFRVKIEVELFLVLLVFLCSDLLKRNWREDFLLKLVLLVFMEWLEFFFGLVLVGWILVKRIFSDDLLLLFDVFFVNKFLVDWLLIELEGLLVFGEIFFFEDFFFMKLLDFGLFFLNNVCREEVFLFFWELLLFFRWYFLFVIFLINI